jgi:hypothetical protein
MIAEMSKESVCPGTVRQKDEVQTHVMERNTPDACSRFFKTKELYLTSQSILIFSVIT